MRQTHSSEKIPDFQGAGAASLLHWWHVFMSMAIDPSLAKFVKQIGNLQQWLAIIYYDIKLHPFLLARKDDLWNT